jgi:hypothetical protein
MRGTHDLNKNAVRAEKNPFLYQPNISAARQKESENCYEKYA